MNSVVDKANIYNILKWTLRVYRYPRYLSDFYCNSIFKLILKRRQCEVGKGIWFNGLPIITTVPNSKIFIGNKILFCSRSVNTALGVCHPVVIRTMKSGSIITIGDGVRMSGVSICAAIEVKIGDNVVIGANAVIADTDFHAIDINSRKSRKQSQDLGNAGAAPVEIESDVFVGANSAILKGVRVGSGAVIGFGCVVTKSVPSNMIVAGNPAKVVGKVIT